MSDIMLHGVLNMPPELWNDKSPIDVMQRHSRYVHASKYIKELERERDEARREAEKYRNLFCIVVNDSDKLPWETLTK